MNSPYPELKALSDEERSHQIKELYKAMRDKHDYTFEIYDFKVIEFMQERLDRIKQLVLTKNSE